MLFPYSGCLYRYKAVWKVKTLVRRSWWWSIEAAAHQITTELYRESNTGIDLTILIRYLHTYFFCLIKVRAMVVDRQQPLTECNVFLRCILSNTAHFPVQWQYTKLSQINSGLDLKTVIASKIKGQCAGYTPNTLILANTPRSVILKYGNKKCNNIALSSKTGITYIYIYTCIGIKVIFKKCFTLLVPKKWKRKKKHTTVLHKCRRKLYSKLKCPLSLITYRMKYTQNLI